MMNMSGEIRRDALVGRIDTLLNGNLDFGFGKLERRIGSRFNLHDTFRGVHCITTFWIGTGFAVRFMALRPKSR